MPWSAVFSPEAVLLDSVVGVVSHPDTSARSHAAQGRGTRAPEAAWCGLEPLEQRFLLSAGPSGLEFTAGDTAGGGSVINAAVATEVSLGPSKDNTLFEDAGGALSNGQGQYLYSGRVKGLGSTKLRRGLLAFDVAASVPAGATIVGASLSMNVSKSISGPLSSGLHRATADWGQGASNSIVMGGGQGAPAEPGDATWLHTFWPNKFWQNTGGDFVAAVSATTDVGFPGSYTWDSTALLVADVQAWLNDPSSNFGWVVLGDESVPGTAKRFDSSEHLNPANRPVLTIQYMTNEPPTVANQIEDQAATEDDLFNFTIPGDTFDDAENDPFTLSATLADDSPLPAWLGFASDTFSGTPTNDHVGTLSVKVTADDAKGGTVSDEFELTVMNTNDVPVVAVPILDQVAAEGVEFDFTVPAGTFTDVDASDVLTLAPPFPTARNCPSGWHLTVPLRRFSGHPPTPTLARSLSK